MRAGTEEEQIRLAELVATLSLATDHWSGNRLEQGLRGAIVAARLAEAAGAGEEEARAAYYLTMLRTVGCAGDGDLGVLLFGDEMGAWGSHLPNGSRLDVLTAVVAHVGRGAPPLGRVGKIVRALFGLRELVSAAETHCETGMRLAEALGVGEQVARGFGQMFERWDGAGHPAGLKHEAIDRAVRIAHLASDAQSMFSIGGLDAATAMVRARAKKGYDPALAERFLCRASSILEDIDPSSSWEAVLGAEPGRPLTLAGEAIDRVLCAMGEYADLKSEYFQGHSANVASIAAKAATCLGLSDGEIAEVRRAGYLHDLGRVSVPREIWDKKDPLTLSERERIRMHTYVTERILCRSSSLGAVSAIASMSHERLDNGGYHRRPSSFAMPVTARALAAADVYAALGEPRPYRDALSSDAAADALRRDARDAGLDPQVVNAILSSVGCASRPTPHPVGLSRRQMQVLRLVARGLTNKEIAAALNVSVRTATHHLEAVFSRIGVTTRAAASLFAAQNGLIQHASDA